MASTTTHSSILLRAIDQQNVVHSVESNGVTKKLVGNAASSVPQIHLMGATGLEPVTSSV